MSGSKTIMGFTGNSPADSPAGAGSSDPRASRTIIGRDLHLPAAQVVPRKSAPMAAPQPQVARPETPGPVPRSRPTSARPSGTSAVVAHAIDDVTEQIPGRRRRPVHSGKTGFPAFARLFGRWTTGGTFRRQSSLDAEADDISVPRDPWAHRFLVLLGAALFSFLIALGAVKLHQCVTAPRPPAVLPSSPASATAPSPAAVAPSPPLPQPSPVAPTLTAQAWAGPSPIASKREVPAGEARPRPSASAPEPRAPKATSGRPVRRSSSSLGQNHPDALLPLAL